MSEIADVWLSLPGSRLEAHGLGVAKYFTGRPCSRGHVSPRLTRHHECYACKIEGRRVRRLAWRRAHPVGLAEQKRVENARRMPRIVEVRRVWAERRRAVETARVWAGIARMRDGLPG